MRHGVKETKDLRQHFLRRCNELCLLGTFFMVTVLSSLLSGCSIEDTNRTKVKDLEYAIVEDADVPEEVMSMIEEKKAADFKITYELDGETYVFGYSVEEKTQLTLEFEEKTLVVPYVMANSAK